MCNMENGTCKVNTFWLPDFLDIWAVAPILPKVSMAAAPCWNPALKRGKSNHIVRSRAHYITHRKDK